MANSIFRTHVFQTNGGFFKIDMRKVVLKTIQHLIIFFKINKYLINYVLIYCFVLCAGKILFQSRMSKDHWSRRW